MWIDFGNLTNAGTQYRVFLDERTDEVDDDVVTIPRSGRSMIARLT